MKKKDTYYLVLTSVFAGIILAMSIIPLGPSSLGFITILPGVSVTLVHIPVLIGVFILPFKYTVMLGFFFGLGSWIASFIFATQAFDLAFQNPLISITPRLLFAVTAYAIFVGLKRVVSHFKHYKITFIVLVSAITFSALFFGSQAIVKNATWNEANTYQAKIYGIDYSEDMLGKPSRTPEPEELLQLELLQEKARDNESKVNAIVTPIVVVLSLGIIVFYVFYTLRKKSINPMIPTVLILGTVVHTVYVLAIVMLFSPSIFTGTFKSAVSLIYTIAATNGLIEALVAVFVGTPLYLAIQNIQEN